jgi:hypothetical protein
MNVLNLLTLYYLFGRQITLAYFVYDIAVMEHDVVITQVDHFREEVTFEIVGTRDLFPSTMPLAAEPKSTRITLAIPSDQSEFHFDLLADGAGDETQLWLGVADEHGVLIQLLDDELGIDAQQKADAAELVA